MIHRRTLAIVVLGIVAVSVIAMVLTTGTGFGPAARGQRSGDTVGVIRIEGAIVGGSSSTDLLSGAMVGADDVVAQLQQAQDDPRIKAVVLRLNTPGGSAAASQEIGSEVRRLRQLGKPVVASMADTAASGGYWIAAETDHIVASPATMTGSIGVIMQLTNLEGLFEKLGVRYETFKSGEHKDIGNPDRPITDTERELLQDMVDDIFDQFVTVVAEGRSLDREAVLRVADGRLFTGRQALEANLVDSLGNFRDALDLAAAMAGIEGDYTVEDLRRPAPWQRLLSRLEGGVGGLIGFGPERLTWIRWALYPEPAR